MSQTRELSPEASLDHEDHAPEKKAKTRRPPSKQDHLTTIHDKQALMTGSPQTLPSDNKDSRHGSMFDVVSRARPHDSPKQADPHPKDGPTHILCCRCALRSFRRLDAMGKLRGIFRPTCPTTTHVAISRSTTGPRTRPRLHKMQP